MEYLAVKFFEKDFFDEEHNSKKAYLKASKWIALNIVKNKKYDKVIWRIEKKSPSLMTVELYFQLDVKNEKKKNCEICKQFHNSFFINTKYNCNSCALQAFLKKIDERKKIAFKYFKEEADKDMR